MCDTFTSFVERCEPLIRQGLFDELDAVLQEHASHMTRCLTCRQFGTFYRAVALGMRQPRDYASAQVLLTVLVESDQVTRPCARGQ